MATRRDLDRGEAFTQIFGRPSSNSGRPSHGQPQQQYQPQAAQGYPQHHGGGVAYAHGGQYAGAPPYPPGARAQSYGAGGAVGQQDYPYSGNANPEYPYSTRSRVSQPPGMPSIPSQGLIHSNAMQLNQYPQQYPGGPRGPREALPLGASTSSSTSSATSAVAQPGQHPAWQQQQPAYYPDSHQRSNTSGGYYSSGSSSDSLHRLGGGKLAPLTSVASSSASMRSSPPPAPQGPSYRNLDSNSSAGTSLDTGSSFTHAPRLPSLDADRAEYDWFGSGNNGQQGSRPQSGTSGPGPSTNSSGEQGLESWTSSPQYTGQSDAASYASDYRQRTSATSMVDGVQQHRDSPQSVHSSEQSHGYMELRSGQGRDLDSQQSAGYPLDPRFAPRPTRRQSPLDRRTSMDSDHTSYYQPSTSSELTQQGYYPSHPSSQATHTVVSYSQSPYQQQQPHSSSSSIHSGGLSHSQSYQQFPGYAGQPPQQYGATPPGGALLRHTSSRKSAESVRVYPTQRAASVYGDRSFSFSGVERPDLRGYPTSQSPRPASDLAGFPPPPGTASSSHSSHNYPGSSASPHPGHVRQMSHPNAHAMVSRRSPIVYPALLSRVAEAFRARVILTERTKDGLSYKDSFDGREAVDKIAYIIRTTDRNLALLLGRALDAQKFFHDVTYDHRLRDSPGELYQFRERLHGSAFGSTTAINGGVALSDNQFAGQTPPHYLPDGTSLPIRPPSPTDTMLSDDSAVPCGVFTLLTDCYSPTCTRDKLCYSIACPRRLEQQARLNLKPKPGLQKDKEEEGNLGDDDRLGSEPGALWIHSVSKEVSDALDDKEKRRQEAINELIYTERDFVRDMEYLREKWMNPLLTGPMLPESRREEFVKQVFWNVTEIHDVNIKLAEAMTRRQKSQPVVQSIGDLILKHAPDFGPFVKYGAHQLYGKYEFEKEKGSNQAFMKFVETTERLPESRKLELNGYLTKPTTRLARYPLLLEAILKSTPEDNPDQQAIPKAVKMVRDYLGKVNYESGRSEARFNLMQLAGQLVFKPGEAVDLNLKSEERDLIFKGPLKKRGGTQSESAELQVYLFDHAILMVKPKSSNKNEQYKVYRKPIPLELLVVTMHDDPATLRASAARPKSLMSRTSNSSKLTMSSNGTSAKNALPDPTSKQGFPITFTHLGRKGYTLTLWSPSWAGRKKWTDKIEQRQIELKERSLVFESTVLSEGFFVGTNRVTCAAPFDGGTQMVFGTDNGVYLANLLAKDKAPVKVVSCTAVTQVDVLEDHGILIVLADKAVQCFLIDHMDPQDAVGAAKRARKISTNASFFKTGVCLNRTLVCIVKSGSVSSTIKTLEPIENHGRHGLKKPTIRKLLQGGNELLRVYKEFYIPTESSSVHFLKRKLCVGCTKGFEIVDLDTLDTQGLLDPADSSLDFVQKRENVRPLAIYRVDGDFLLCYDEFAFYVNKNGWRARSNWIVQWEGHPTAFALHYPFVLAFEPTFVEVRHVDTGALMQIIPGINLRLLFADTPPSTNPAAMSGGSALAHSQYPYAMPHLSPPHGQRHPLQSSQGSQQHMYSPSIRMPGPRRQIIFASEAGVQTLREAS